MSAVEFDPSRFSKAALAMITLKAQEWGVSPAEAVTRLLNELVKQAKDAA